MHGSGCNREQAGPRCLVVLACILLCTHPPRQKPKPLVPRPHPLDPLPRQIGFVAHALRLAFYHLRRRSTFEAALHHTLAAGGDTDINACIVGGMVGALHGAAAIPADLRSKVEGYRPLPPGQAPADCATAPGACRERPERLWGAQLAPLARRLYEEATADAAVAGQGAVEQAACSARFAAATVAARIRSARALRQGTCTPAQTPCCCTCNTGDYRGGCNGAIIGGVGGLFGGQRLLPDAGSLWRDRQNRGARRVRAGDTQQKDERNKYGQCNS